MNKYVVRQPIKDAQQNIFAYEILFHDEGGSLYNQNNDYAAADTIASFLMQNNEKVFKDHITFITFTPNLLFKHTPKMFKQSDLVIQIEDNIIVHPLAMSSIQRYKKEHYQIAVNDFQFAPRYFGIMEYIDYIKLDFANTAPSSLSNIIKMAKAMQKRCIATGLNTKELYDLAVELDVDYFQGAYVAEVRITKANKTEYLQSNFFQLVVAVTKDEPDMAEIESIISRDATLTYALLKMVNSAYFALRNRASSIQQALVILGLGQLKQWVYLLSFNRNSDPATEDLLRISFMRANFCSELLAYVEDMPISKSEAYLMGMFSTLDHLVDAPLEELLAELPISEDIVNALTKHEGKCGLLYDLVLTYELADWSKIKKYTEQLGIPDQVISQIYFDCIENVNMIWDNLVSSESQAEMGEEIKITSKTVLDANKQMSEE